MTISTKGRYALRVMIDMAEHPDLPWIPLREIAIRQEISEKYLEIILKMLVKNGLLVGLRGKGGGYRLTRSPSDYTVAEILQCTEKSLAPVACVETACNMCPRAADCRTLPMWMQLNDLIRDFFSGITLQDLARPAECQSEANILILPDDKDPIKEI